jgi:hypothetical protein
VPYPSLDSQGFKAYVIAIKGGGGGGEGTPTDEHGKPSDEHGKPSDEHGKPSDKHEEHKKMGEDHGLKEFDKQKTERDEADGKISNIRKFDSSQFTSSVANYIGVEPNQIARSMRNVDNFRDLLDIYNIKVSEIATALNLPTNNTQFFKEVKRIIEQ